VLEQTQAFTYTGVWHDFHIRWCSCRLAVTGRVSHVHMKQELLTPSEHLSSPRFLVRFVLLNL